MVTILGSGIDLDNASVVIVTHGLTLRLLLMRWFQYTVPEFNASKNPRNAFITTMKLHKGQNHQLWYELTEESRDALQFPLQSDSFDAGIKGLNR